MHAAARYSGTPDRVPRMPWTAALGLGIVAGYVELIAGNGPYAELIASQRGGLVRL